MPLLSNRPVDKRFLGLFVGRSGSGKKCAAASFPGLIKYLDFDGRVGGIDGASWIDRSKIDYEAYPPKMASGLFAVKVNKDLDIFMAQCAQSTNYKTLFLGSFTGILKSILAEAVALNTKSPKTGQISMSSPPDFKYEIANADSVIAYLRSIPIQNVILSAHIIDKWGKPTDKNGAIIDPYAPSVVIGNKLNVRSEQIAETTPAFFDHIFEFEKRETGDRITYWARFRSSLARTSYSFLPDGWVDITGKDFYQYLQSMKPKEEEVKK